MIFWDFTYASDCRGKGPDTYPWGKEHANGTLDAWASDIVEWAGFLVSDVSANSQHSNDGNDSDDSELTVWEANKIAPCFESFVLFVAHHVKEHFSQRVATGLFQPEDCRLILPVANTSKEAECTDFDSVDFVDPVDFAHVECGMFPFDSNVDRQAAPAPQLIVADAEIAREKHGHDEAEVRLATRTNALYFNQHNRRFAWGLTASNRKIHTYVFGPDDIWASTEMDITSAEGRRALISLYLYLVDDIGSPYLAIDVHEMDESTGKVGHCMYYSKRCVGAADRLTGCHDRCFAASSTPKSMDKPTFLIKDVWTTLSSGSAGDTRESSFLKALQDVFGGSDTSKGSFSHFLSTGPVYVNRGGTLVVDSTTTALAGLPSTTQNAAKDSGDTKGLSSSNVHQHRRTVSRWAGNMISAAANPSQVIVAIADAMVALNAAYVKCKILHGNLSDRAVQLQKIADGVKGVLADLDYASYAGGSADRADAPELMLFQSIHALERLAIAGGLDLRSSVHARARSSRLGDCESILNAVIAARVKREHMDTERSFYVNIASKMVDGPLRRLAVEMHRILFLHPEFPGAMVTLEGVDPLVARNNFEEAIVAALLALMEEYRREALLALQGQLNVGTRSMAEQSAGPLKKRILNAAPETSTMMPRSKVHLQKHKAQCHPS
ncbi:hypothetical protein GGI17_003144 [Coemansia sp. S146]|nr:hypothetical protein GGI17_003144 [Coemansia sp. S146]